MTLNIREFDSLKGREGICRDPKDPEGEKAVCTYRIEDLVNLPREENGVDWGAERSVLLRFGEKELWFVPGHSVWNGIAMPRAYRRSSYRMVDTKAPDPFSYTTLWEGRFSRKALRQNATRIAGFFRIPVEVALGIEPKKTVFVQSSESSRAEEGTDE
jgi:hypothetical protein